jgi:hypothetical protein
MGDGDASGAQYAARFATRIAVPLSPGFFRQRTWRLHGVYSI